MPMITVVRWLFRGDDDSAPLSVCLLCQAAGASDGGAAAVAAMDAGGGGGGGDGGGGAASAQVDAANAAALAIKREGWLERKEGANAMHSRVCALRS